MDGWEGIGITRGFVGMENGGGMRLGRYCDDGKRGVSFHVAGVFECGYEVDGRMKCFLCLLKLKWSRLVCLFVCLFTDYVFVVKIRHGYNKHSFWCFLSINY